MLSRRRWFDCSIHQLLQLFSHSVRGGQTMKPFFKESPKKVAQEGHLLAPPLRNCTATIAASPRIVDRGYLIIHFMFRLFSFLHWKFYQCLRTHERTFDHVVRGDQCTSPSPCVHRCRRSRYPSKQKEMFASPFSFCHSIQITFNDTADRLPLFSPVRLENKATWERREGKKRGSDEPVWSAVEKMFQCWMQVADLLYPYPEHSLVYVAFHISISLLLVLLEQSLFFGGGKQQTFSPFVSFLLFSPSALIHTQWCLTTLHRQSRTIAAQTWWIKFIRQRL